MSEQAKIAKRHALSSKFFLLAALMLATVAALPLLAEPGLLNTRGGGDSPFLLQRLQQLETAVLDGHFPARWMPDANYGYGYPFYNFYAPLSIYITLLFRFVGFSYVRAIHLSQLAGFWVAAWGMFALGKQWWRSDWAGLITAVSYTVAPFHLVNVYVRGDSLAEFWAMAFYPLTFLAAKNIAQAAEEKRPLFRPIALFALAYAALVLSHNISALIFSPFLGLYLIKLTINNSQSTIHNLSSEAGQAKQLQGVGDWGMLFIRRAFPLFASLALGLALSAWFFLPALAERDLAQLGPVTSGYFSYTQHFRGWDLLQLRPIFDYSVTGQEAFRSGMVQVLLALAGLLVGGWLLVRRELVAWWLGGLTTAVFLISTFMITPLSEPLWANLPLLDFTQFPWRFLSVQAFGAALLIGLLGRLPQQKLIAPLLIGLLLVTNLAGLETDHLHLRDEDVTAERLAQYEWFTGNIGTTVSFEYLPPAVQPRPFSSPWLVRGERFATWGANVQATPIAWQTQRQAWRVVADEATTLTLPTLMWPGWTAVLNNQPVELRPASGSGLITLDLPAGEHELDLRLTRPPIRRNAELLSLAALLLTIGLLLWPSREFLTQRRRDTKVDFSFSAFSARSAVILMLLCAAVLFFYDEPLGDASRVAHVQTWDFAQFGYLHSPKDGVLFENGAVLRSFESETAAASVGGTVRFTAVFESGNELPITLDLVSPAAAWPAYAEAAPQPIVRQTAVVQGGMAQFELSIPNNAPAGLWLPRLSLPSRALTDSGNRRGDLFLTPIRVQSEAVQAEPIIPVLQVEALSGRKTAASLQLKLRWQTPRPLTTPYKLSLRLLNEAGLPLTQFDVQPGFGFWPSMAWSPNRWQHDWLAMPLHDDLLSLEQPHPLQLLLYEEETGDIVLTRRLGFVQMEGETAVLVPNEPSFDQLFEDVRETAVFGDADNPLIRLLGSSIEQEGRLLQVRLTWESLVDNPPDLRRFIHLSDLNAPDQPPLLQQDGLTQGNSYPTSQWVAGEIVTETAVFDLSSLPDGNYQLTVGLYDPDTLTRLQAIDDNGVRFPADAALLSQSIQVK